jgi:hypothetical protein
MTGELLGSAPGETRAVTVSEIDLASEKEAPRERGNGAVAILLATAAVVAAIIGARASMVSSDANDSWQSALRTEVKRSAAAMNDVQTLYQEDLPTAIRVLQAEILSERLAAGEAGQTPAVGQALQMEAGVQTQLVKLMSPSSGLTSSTAYALPSGGYDLGKRLADIRAKSPGMLALDPDGLEKTGDRSADKAVLLTLALFPTSLCALFAVLAQPLRRFRRGLLAGGLATLVVGVVMALGVEVLA